MGLFVTLNFATVSVGVSFSGGEGKFSLSNFGPVLFVAAALLLARDLKVPRTVVLSLLVFNVCALGSYFFFLTTLGWSPNFVVLAFQNVELAFAWLLFAFAISRRQEFVSCVRLGIYLSLPVLAYFVAQDIAQGRLSFYFGMDDKSHASVILCCESFILIRYLRKPSDHIVALTLYVLSFLTVSRLPVFFAPALFLAGFQATGPGLARQILILAIGLILFVLMLNGEIIIKTFVVFDRLSSVAAVAGEGSTSAHLLLIKKACEIKLANAVSFFIGIGPGNFSKALIDFPVSIFDINAVDPSVVPYALEGRAPLHSTPFSFLIDYNFIVLAGLGVTLCKGLSKLVTKALWPELLIAIGFIGASTFYSFHNKPYFFLFVASFIALITVSQKTSSAVKEQQMSAPRGQPQLGPSSAGKLEVARR